ncbi:MAG: hypothetical protein J5503_02200 [Muribaculaceae bacterium]|nr:hypothetical protein [Muribaculaceae bacterium]
MKHLVPRLWGSIQCDCRHLLTVAVLLVIMAACGTGIEVTERVSDKDVRRVVEQIDSRQQTVTLEPYLDSLKAWNLGKRLWVADDQIKELFAVSSAYDKDTLHLAGRILLYDGSWVSGVYLNDYNDRRLYLDLKDSQTGAKYGYRAGKEVEASRPGFTFPMLIDMDMVEHYARQIASRDFYIKTPIWYDRQSEQMMDGRHFIKVHIDSVVPGNAVLPLRVLFTTADTRERAMVWMSDNTSTMHGRDFDAMFVASDPHQAYPDITDANWERITRGQVAVGMTKQECQLALGGPKSINRNPDQSGMREYWYYDGGSYLYFVDGLLSQFRR